MNPDQAHFEVPFSEMEIMTDYALRFDGYGYVDATGFDYIKDEQGREYEDAFAATGEFPEDPEQRMCILFMLQRFLGKWGGERSPHDAKYWRMFRHLFLQTAHLDVRPEYRHEGYYRSWAARDEDERNRDVQTIRQIHDTTRYAD